MDWMLQLLEGLHPIVQALIATLFTWGLTAVGAAVVFFTKTVSRRYLDASLGFAADVMVAASFWSLLAPSIALSEDLELVPWVPPLIGFLIGGVVLRLADGVLTHLHLFAPALEAEGVSTHWRRVIF